MSHRRRFVFEKLEARYAMDADGVASDVSHECPAETGPPASEWQSALVPTDVNRDGVISPLDVLIVLNDLNQNGARALKDVPASTTVDVNGDGYAAPSDVLAIINELNDPGRDTAVALAEAYLASDFPHLDWQLETVRKDTVRRNDTGVYELTYCTPIPELIVSGPRTILVTPSTRAVELLFRD